MSETVGHRHLVSAEQGDIVPTQLPRRQGGIFGDYIGCGGEDGTGHIVGMDVVGFDHPSEQVAGCCQHLLGSVFFDGSCAPNASANDHIVSSFSKKKGVELAAPRPVCFAGLADLG
jgi:hypothetical protein